MPKLATIKCNNWITQNWYMLEHRCKKCLEAENIPLTDLINLPQSGPALQGCTVNVP